jgi:hypothetical protein
MMKKTERAKTRTGQVARVEVDPPVTGEPPPPATLPEFPELNSTTGIMRAFSEGEDGAKAADDPRHSAPEPMMPKKRRSQGTR